MNFSIGRWKPGKIYHKTVWRLLGDPARRDPTGFCKHGKMCVDFWPRERNDEFPLPRLDGHTNAAKVMRGHVRFREATDTREAAGHLHAAPLKPHDSIGRRHRQRRHLAALFQIPIAGAERDQAVLSFRVAWNALLWLSH